MTKLSKEALLAWLVVSRYALGKEDVEEFIVPKDVGDGWIELGWQVINDRGEFIISDIGKIEADLVAPEFGVDPIQM